MYVMLCAKSNVCFVVGMVSRYQSNLSLEHRITTKHILKYLRRVRDYMFVFQNGELVLKGHTYSNFSFDKDSRKFTFDFVFTFDGVVVNWRSVKQSCIVDSTMEAKYIVVSKLAKEVV